MALVKATLQSTLEALFSSMGDNATNKDFVAFNLRIHEGFFYLIFKMNFR